VVRHAKVPDGLSRARQVGELAGASNDDDDAGQEQAGKKQDEIPERDSCCSSAISEPCQTLTMEAAN